MTGERLSKYLAHSGVASRRNSEEIIRSGMVSVNGEIITDPYHQVNGERDLVTFEGRPIRPATTQHYIALYKPPGYISDLKDPKGRRLARDLIPLKDSLFPVGRLDYNSEGLILFTNDGDFANKLMHPRYQVEKEYHVKVTGVLTTGDVARLLAGVRIQGETYRVKSITLSRRTAHNAWYRVILTEGKNRMIRKLAEAVCHPVIKLKRTRIADISLDNLKPGKYRRIDRREVKAILDPSDPQAPK